MASKTGGHSYVLSVLVCNTIRSSETPRWKLVARPQFGQFFKRARDTKNTAVCVPQIPRWKLVARPQFGQFFKRARDTKNTAVSLCTTYFVSYIKHKGKILKIACWYC